MFYTYLQDISYVVHVATLEGPSKIVAERPLKSGGAKNGPLIKIPVHQGPCSQLDHESD